MSEEEFEEFRRAGEEIQELEKTLARLFDKWNDYVERFHYMAKPNRVVSDEGLSSGIFELSDYRGWPNEDELRSLFEQVHEISGKPKYANCNRNEYRVYFLRS